MICNRWIENQYTDDLRMLWEVVLFWEDGMGWGIGWPGFCLYLENHHVSFLLCLEAYFISPIPSILLSSSFKLYYLIDLRDSFVDNHWLLLRSHKWCWFYSSTETSCEAEHGSNSSWDCFIGKGFTPIIMCHLPYDTRASIDSTQNN